MNNAQSMTQNVHRNVRLYYTHGRPNSILPFHEEGCKPAILVTDTQHDRKKYKHTAETIFFLHTGTHAEDNNIIQYKLL